MCSIQFECCPSTTVTLGPIKNSLIILSLYLSTVFQSFRAGEKGYYVTQARVMVLVHDTSSQCALQMYEVFIKISLTVIKL